MGLVVNTELSLKSSFVKFDWKVTASEWLGMTFSSHDAAYIYRFHEDGTYEVDITPNMPITFITFAIGSLRKLLTMATR